MASIIDAFQSYTEDKFFSIKLLATSTIVGFPTYYFIKRIISEGRFVLTIEFYLALIGLIFLLGLLAFAARNSIRILSPLIPNIFKNVHKIFLHGAFGALTIIPGLIIGIILCYFGVPFIKDILAKYNYDNFVVTYILYFIFILTANGIIVTQFMCYSQNYNIIHAFNPVRLYKYYSLLTFETISFVIQAIFINIVIFILPGWILYLIFGIDNVFISFLILIGILTLFLAMNFFGQSYEDKLETDYLLAEEKKLNRYEMQEYEEITQNKENKNKNRNKKKNKDKPQKVKKQSKKKSKLSASDFDDDFNPDSDDFDLDD